MTFLRIPPFPGARSGPVQMAAPRASPCAVTASEVAAALVKHRVGGAFWGAQPPLPMVAGLLVLDGCDADALAGPTVHIDRFLRIEGRGPICDPWHLVGWAKEVCAPATSDVGLVALLLGKPLTGQGGVSLEAAIRAVLLDGQSFCDPFSGEPCDVLAIIRLLGFWRTLIDANRPIDRICGIAFWKQNALAPLLWGGAKVRFSRKVAPDAGQTVALWRARTPQRSLDAMDAGGCRTLEIEDGFIRSIGLGADCVPPLSIVVDGKAAHFDPASPSQLEDILSTHRFTDEQRVRAAALRRVLVSSGISKYGKGGGAFRRAGGERRHVLVIGQVEDDRSWLKGGGGIASNLELLRRVRARHSGAWLIFRPHPDVMAGHRKGHVATAQALQLADEIAASTPITALLGEADEVHVLTSLTGFEALLREKPVTTWGVPFYAGWGLTTDLGPVPPRRGRRLVLDELVAAALLLYPRYLDPVTMLPCPPEVTVQRLIEGRVPSGGSLVRLRRLTGRASHVLRTLRSLFGGG